MYALIEAEDMAPAFFCLFFLTLLNVQFVVWPFQKGDHLGFVPDEKCIVEYLRDIVPENKVLLGIGVGVAIDMDNVVRIHSGVNIRGPVALVDTTEPLYMFLSRFSL